MLQKPQYNTVGYHSIASFLNVYLSFFLFEIQSFAVETTVVVMLKVSFVQNRNTMSLLFVIIRSELFFIYLIRFDW